MSYPRCRIATCEGSAPFFVWPATIPLFSLLSIGLIAQALKTTYHQTERYIEVDIDVSANTVANYATGMCRGAANTLVIDMGKSTLHVTLHVVTTWINGETCSSKIPDSLRRRIVWMLFGYCFCGLVSVSHKLMRRQAY